MARSLMMLDEFIFAFIVITKAQDETWRKVISDR